MFFNGLRDLNGSYQSSNSVMDSDPGSLMCYISIRFLNALFASFVFFNFIKCSLISKLFFFLQTKKNTFSAIKLE